MWTLAVGMFAAFKGITFWPVRHRPSVARGLAFLIGWPGMDAGAFFAPRGIGRAQSRDFVDAAIKTVLGAALIWLVARGLMPAHPLFAGWVVMVGIVLVLHFGVLELISLLWRGAGFNVPPLMDH